MQSAPVYAKTQRPHLNPVQCLSCEDTVSRPKTSDASKEGNKHIRKTHKVVHKCSL